MEEIDLIKVFPMGTQTGVIGKDGGLETEPTIQIKLHIEGGGGGEIRVITTRTQK